MKTLKLEMQALILSTVNRELVNRPDIKEFLVGENKLDDIFLLVHG